MKLLLHHARKFSFVPRRGGNNLTAKFRLTGQNREQIRRQARVTSLIWLAVFATGYTWYLGQGDGGNSDKSHNDRNDVILAEKGN